MQTAYACAICDESLPDDTPPLSRRYYYPVHARCAEAGEAVIGLAAAMLAEQGGALVCVACLAAELGISRVESASALWHLARQLPLAPGACGCGASGCRLV